MAQTRRAGEFASRVSSTSKAVSRPASVSATMSVLPSGVMTDSVGEAEVGARPRGGCRRDRYGPARWSGGPGGSKQLDRNPLLLDEAVEIEPEVADVGAPVRHRVHHHVVAVEGGESASRSPVLHQPSRPRSRRRTVRGLRDTTRRRPSGSQPRPAGSPGTSISTRTSTATDTGRPPFPPATGSSRVDDTVPAKKSTYQSRSVVPARTLPEMQALDEGEGLLGDHLGHWFPRRLMRSSGPLPAMLGGQVALAAEGDGRSRPPGRRPRPRSSTNTRARCPVTPKMARVSTSGIFAPQEPGGDARAHVGQGVGHRLLIALAHDRSEPLLGAGQLHEDEEVAGARKATGARPRMPCPRCDGRDRARRRWRRAGPGASIGWASTRISVNSSSLESKYQ